MIRCTSLLLCTVLLFAFVQAEEQSCCGDGVKNIDLGEECDLGVLNGQAGVNCTVNCTLIICGNGRVDPGEQCDLGSHNGVAGCNCTAQCTIPVVPICGNGIVETGEQCDLGSLNGATGCNCTAQCTIPVVPICGNGIVEYGEQCDLGSLNGATGCNCTAQCTIPVVPICGNGIVEYGEQCDLGSLNGQSGRNCTAQCTIPIVPICGNGIVESGEQCDDGNSISGDGCSAQCQLELGCCGDGIIQGGEECDNGQRNGQPGSNCTVFCRLFLPTIPLCGDGIVQVFAGEQCDLGSLNGQPGSSCSLTCKTVQIQCICGDGVVTFPEECDNGALNGRFGSNCTSDCKFKVCCGNGEVEFPEECDAGSSNGQGFCSSSCTLVNLQYAGCTAGFWRAPLRVPAPFTLTTSFYSVFGINIPGTTLQFTLYQALLLNCDELRCQFARESVAALFNAVVLGRRFKLPEGEVRLQVYAALISSDVNTSMQQLLTQFQTENNRQCPLGTHWNSWWF